MRNYFPAFLILPSIAAYRLAGPLDGRYLIGYFIAISLVTYLFYGFDKRRSRSGGWRTPETTLHLLEALGGWVAAFLAQQQFRHKTSKRRYQTVFWCIVGAYQYVAFEYAFGWPVFNGLRRLVTGA